MRNSVSKVSFILGLIFLTIALYLVWERNNPARLNFTQTPKTIAKPVVNNNQEKKPVQIVIKDLNINVPLYPSQINGTTWETTTLGASYLLSSPIPGENGNSIVYAHNWNNLFGRLVFAKPGENVRVVFSNNTSKSFTIKYTAVVNPDQTYILDNSEDTRITLFTCTGFFDQKRFIAVAILN